MVGLNVYPGQVKVNHRRIDAGNAQDVLQPAGSTAGTNVGRAKGVPQSVREEPACSQWPTLRLSRMYAMASMCRLPATSPAEWRG